jgi:transketolase
MSEGSNTVRDIRKSILKMAHYSRASHIGSCLSVVEILYVLYFKVASIDPADPRKKDRDRIILSKGHGSAALYATLAERGFFHKSLLDKYYIDGGILPGHLDMLSVPGIEVSSGALGHGLSLGLGMAIANKLTENPGKVFVILGDGECNEGSVWEAIMLGGTHKLDNIVAIVDCNKLQGFGRTNNVINQDNLGERWHAFGWEVFEVDGHNECALEQVLTSPQKGPRVVVAHTTKGRGVSFMEDKLEWHYKSPNDAQLDEGLRELEQDL